MFDKLKKNKVVYSPVINRFFSLNGNHISVSEYTQDVRANKQKLFFTSEYNSIIRNIKGRYNSCCLYYNFSDKYFYFFHSYNEDIIQILSNKTGILSFVNEYMPLSKARRFQGTNNALELLKVVEARLPRMELHVLGLEEVLDYEKILTFKLSQPIPELQRHLAPNQNLFPEQNETLRKMLKLGNSFINGSKIGSGKTLLSLSYAILKNYSILVVAPKVVRRVWVDEAEKFYPNYFNPIIYQKNDDNINSLSNNLVIMNYECFREMSEDIEDGKFDLLILEESHRLKNIKAKITQRTLRNEHKFKEKVLLTGTFTPNKRKEAYTQLNICRRGYIDQDELNCLTIGSFWNRVHNDIYVRLQTTKKSKIKKTQRMINLPQLTKEIPSITDIGDFQKWMHKLALLKLPYTLELIEDILASGDCVLVASEFTDVVEQFSKLAIKKRINCVKHHGKLSDRENDLALSTFLKDDKCRVLFTTRPSMAEGLTLIKANHVILNDLPFVPAQIEQFEGRTYRTGQTKDVFSYWMVADDIYDQGKRDILYAKYHAIVAINEGKQLSEEQRKLFDEPIRLLDLFKNK